VVECPSNTYRKAGICKQCPINSTAPAASFEQTACRCDPNFYLNVILEDWSCLRCPGEPLTSLFPSPSSFLSLSLSRPLSLSLSLSLSISLSLYHSLTLSLSSNKTPSRTQRFDHYLLLHQTDNSESPCGSNRLTDCVCNPGFVGPNGGPCTPCPVNTYKAIKGNHNCTSCNASSALCDSTVDLSDCHHVSVSTAGADPTLAQVGGDTTPG
jgi:hypothetical protein